MKLSGNYRTETWEKKVDEVATLSSFTVDDEQVTLTYELWANILTELGFAKADA